MDRGVGVKPRTNVAYGELLVSLEKGSLQTAPSATQLGMFPYIMEKRRDVIALESLIPSQRRAFGDQTMADQPPPVASGYVPERPPQLSIG